jgi:hypothetical protein
MTRLREPVPSGLRSPFASFPFTTQRTTTRISNAVAVGPDHTLLLASSRFCSCYLGALYCYWGDGERSKLIPIRGGVGVRYSLRASSAPGRRHINECAMAEIVLGRDF